MFFTIPNVITLTRILLMPFVVESILSAEYFRAAVIFTLAALTDLFDGYYARISDQSSAFGKAFDPLADKILMIGTFGALLYKQLSCESVVLFLPPWFLAVVFVRELILLLGWIFLRLCFKKVAYVEPTWWGKVTMAGYMGLVSLVLCSSFFEVVVSQGIMSMLLFFISSAALFSLMQYVKRAYDRSIRF